MKVLLNLIIVGMFGAEMCSPFMIGYLNEKDKKIKENRKYIENRKKEQELNLKLSNYRDLNWKKIDYSEHNYSDSKSLKIKE